MTRFTCSLDGETVVMTGGAGILGTVFSDCLLGAGATLVIGDLDQDTCSRREEELRRTYGPRVHGLAVDVTDQASVAAFRDRIAELGLDPSVLINNIGTKTPKFFAPLPDFPLEDWEQVMRVNVTGIFLTVRAFLPQFLARGKAVIISTGSIYGELGPDQRIYDGSWYPEMGGAINTPLVYAASKGAVSSITRYLATIYGDRGIRANTLVPGGVFSGQNDTFVQKYSARVPMGRMADKEEMASALLFLASPASSYVNGQELMVDGGLSAW